jgi:hypothetical protein
LLPTLHTTSKLAFDTSILHHYFVS